MMSRYLTILMLYLSTPCAAWWDEGHMVVAAVAKLTMQEWPESRVNYAVILDKIFALWTRDYPAYTEMISAAVWADHIKCTHPSPVCESENHHFESMEIFNPLHYNNLPVHFDDSGLDPPEDELRCLAARSVGAGWLLQNIATSLSFRLARAASLEDPLATCNSSIRRNRHLGNSSSVKSLGRRSTRGSSTSYNLLLRLFVHIFGDVHQPLHASEGVAADFPHGDRGGLEVPIKLSREVEEEFCNSAVKPGSLHELWDSAGCLFISNYPTFTVKDALGVAADLRVKYPISFFDSRNSPVDIPIIDILLESRALSLKAVYLENLFRTPSREYMDNLREVSRQQLVLGGYRLAKYLKTIAEEIEVSKILPDSSEYSTVKNNNHSRTVTSSTFGTQHLVPPTPSEKVILSLFAVSIISSLFSGMLIGLCAGVAISRQKNPERETLLTAADEGVESGYHKIS